MHAPTAIEPERGNVNVDGAADLGLPQLIDVATLAAHLGPTAGQIPFLKLGHLIRFVAEEIRAWLDRARSVARPGHTTAGQNGTRP